MQKPGGLFLLLKGYAAAAAGPPGFGCSLQVGWEHQKQSTAAKWMAKAS